MVDNLLTKIDQKKNPCIIGLDPRMEQIPDFLKNKAVDYSDQFQASGEIIFEFNKLIIDATSDIVPAVKLQIAFYEQYKSYGLKAFEDTLKYAKEKGLIVIGDVKRNDIGSTAEAYANSHLGKVFLPNGNTSSSLDLDFITVTPYLGSDGIEPFIKTCKEFNKGIFILVKTSNPSSGELQDQTIANDQTVYEKTAEYVAQAGDELKGQKGYSQIGAVVGATYPEQAEKLRKIMPQNIFLVPGYGAQGGRAKDILPCFNKDGYGALISSSRAIIFAYSKEPYKNKYKPEEFYLASRESAINMRDDVVNTLKEYNKLPASW